MRFDRNLAQAWLFLMALLWIFFGFGLLVAWGLMHYGIRPDRIFLFSTAGIHYVARPIMSRWADLGFNPALIILFLNLLATLALASPLAMIPLFDPRRTHYFPSRLRRVLINDPTLAAFRPFPGFRAIPDPELRPLFAWLYFLPLFPVGLLGTIIGLATASGCIVFGSIPLVAGYLLPHGFLEIPAILLGGSLPLGAYFAVHDSLHQARTDAVFSVLGERRRFRRIRWTLLAILVLLGAAAVVEAYFTENFALWFQSRWG